MRSSSGKLKTVLLVPGIFLLCLVGYGLVRYRLSPMLTAQQLCKVSENCLRGLSLGERGAYQLVYSPDGTQLFAAGVGGAKRWTTETYQAAGLVGRGRRVAVAADGRYAVAKEDGEVEVFNTEGEKVLEFSTLAEGIKDIRHLVFTPGYDLLAMPGAGLSFWSTRDGSLVTTLPHEAYITGLAVSSQGIIAASQIDGTIILWPVGDFRDYKALAASDKSVGSLAFNSDGTVLVAGDSAGNVTVWDVATGNLRSQFSGTESLVSGIGVSPDARQVVVGHSAGVLAVWDTEAASELASWQYRRGIGEIALSPDGNQVAIALRRDASLQDWNERPYTQQTAAERRGTDGMEDSYVAVSPAAIIVRDLATSGKN